MICTITKSIEKWEAFKKELIFSNRFFPKVSLIDDIKSIILQRSDTIAKGKVLFRAREYIIDDLFENRESDPNSTSTEKDRKKRVNKMLYSNLVTVADSDFYTDLMQHHVYEDVIREKAQKSEWGFSKEESGKTPKSKSIENRANPRYITYLYLASDINTALAEARAQIEQIFSVAQYEIMDEIKVVNLTSSLSACDQFDENDSTMAFYVNIHRAFSAPSYSDGKDYIVSQYIAEFIKSLGFDGLIFDSSRKKGGTNYTLFDDTACKFLCSELHSIENIQIESKRLLPR